MRLEGTIRERPPRPFQKIAREGKTFSLRAGRTQTTGEPQATEKWLQRAPQLRGNEKTHTQGFRAGGSAATREGFPSQGILSIRGQRRPSDWFSPKSQAFTAGRDSSAPPYAQAYEQRQSARGGRSHDEEGGGSPSEPNRCTLFSSTALPPFLLDPPFTGFSDSK